MPGDEAQRASPDALLALAKKEGRGHLKIFLGAAPGVGKTYAMLTSARTEKSGGRDVVAGLIETHGRRETEQLIEGFEVLPRKPIVYRNQIMQEFDLDAALARRPEPAAGRRIRPHQCARQPPSQALAGYRRTACRRHRRLDHAQHPAPRKPQRRCARRSPRCACARPCRIPCSTRPTRSSWSIFRPTNCSSGSPRARSMFRTPPRAPSRASSSRKI